MEKAISKLRLKDIYLNESKIIRDHNFTNESNQDGIYQQELLKIEAEELIPDDVSFPNLLRCVVTVGARFVRDSAEDQDEVDEMATIEASFCVIYEKTDEISDDCLKEFMKFNVVHNVWSFWRQHAYATARESKLPLPEVPFFRAIIKKDD